MAVAAPTGLQKVLLTKVNLTLEKVIEIAQGMEAATLKAKKLKGSHRLGAGSSRKPTCYLDAELPLLWSR